MVLVGHSLGAYLASAYAVRYPHRVSGLIMVSPAGVPHGPEYKRYRPSGEKNEGDLEEAADAVEHEMGEGGESKEVETKGEAKQWRDNRKQSLFRRQGTKCELALFPAESTS